MTFAVLTCAASLMSIGTPAMAYPPAWIVARQQAWIAAQQRAIQQQEWAVAQQQAWIAAEQQRQAAWLAARQQAAWLESQQRAAWHAARRQAMEQAALQQAAEQAALQAAPRALVTLVNPQGNGTAVNFFLSGQAFQLPPGSFQSFQGLGLGLIEFDRGGGSALARYTLADGIYVFTATDAGWDLVRLELDGSGE
jgi:hypothetical protein